MVKKTQTDLIPAPAAEIITSEMFKDVEGFVALEVREQDKIINEHRNVIKNADAASKNIQATGNSLYNIREWTKKTRTWESYCEKHVYWRENLARATVSRLLLKVEARRKLELPALIERELDRLPKPIDVKKLGFLPAAPKDPTPEQAKEYVASMVSAQKTSAKIKSGSSTVEANTRQLAQAALIRDFQAEYEQMHGKAKQKLVQDMCGYFLHIGGFSTGQTISPSPVPENLVWEKLKPRGRPRLKKQG
jgi:hypothetical protein